MSMGQVLCLLMMAAGIGIFESGVKIPLRYCAEQSDI